MAAVAVLVAACGRELPAPETARHSGEPAPGASAAPPSGTATASVPASTPPAARAELDFRLAWLVPSPAWTKAVAIAPWGDVVSYGSRSLRLHGGASGKLLAEASTCFTFPNAFGFVGPSAGALVCEASIDVFEFPGATFHGVLKLPGKARAAAFGSTMVAVGFAEGPLRLYSTRDWRLASEIQVAGKPSALALSRDERRLAIGLDDGRAFVRDLGQGSEVPLATKLGPAVSALALSPDGSQLFVGAGPRAGVWSASDGTPIAPLALVGEVSAARWLAADELVTTGRDGLLVVSVPDGAVRTLGDGSDAANRPPVTLDLSLDGRVLCTGAPEGSLRCFSRGGPPSAAELPRPAVQPDGCVPDAARAVSVAGRVQSHSGRHLLLRIDGGAELPPVGACVRLLRHLRTAQGQLDTSSWPEVAQLRVEELRKDVVRADIVAGPAAAQAGDPEARPLDYDTPVRLVWSKP